MKAIQNGILFFFLIIVLIPLCYSAEIQESALVAKYIFLAALLSITSLVFFKKIVIQFKTINSSILLLLLYLIFSFIGLFGALYIPDAFYESSKIALFSLSIVVVLFFLNKTEIDLIKKIASFASLAILLACAFSLPELAEALRSKDPLSSTIYLISGLNGHKNLLSSWLLLLVPLSLIHYKKGTEIGILNYTAAIIGIAFILLLQARATLVGLAIGIGVYLLIRFGSQKIQQAFLIGIMSLLALLILMIIASPIIENTLSGTRLNSASAQERLILWERTIYLIKEHPIFGIGGGNWKFLFPSQGLDGLYRAELNNVVFLRPHNDFLWIWAEHGLLSLLAYLGFIISLLWAGIKSIGQKEGGWESKQIAIAGVFAYLAMSLFDFPKERIEHQIALALFCAIILWKNTRLITYATSKLTTRIVLSALIGICAVSSFFGFQKYSAEKHWKKLITLKDINDNRGLLAEAKQINTKWIWADNNAIPLDWYTGNAYYNLGNMQKAKALYINATKINPYNFNALNNAGVTYFSEKNYTQAIVFFEKALKINKRNDECRLNLCAAYINQAKWQLAKQTLAQVQSKTARTESLRKMIEANLN